MSVATSEALVGEALSAPRTVIPRRPALGLVRPLTRRQLPAALRTSTTGVSVPTTRGEALYVNFDHAASTPAIAAVEDAVSTALRGYASVHRGNGYLSRQSSERYEQARDAVRRFVGARRADHVIFTRNTTDSFALLASALPTDTTVVVFETEHHSTLLPWRGPHVVRLAVPADVNAAIHSLDEALQQRSTRNALVVIAGASNVTGELWPLSRIVATARLNGARVALDAAQLLPHTGIDISVAGVDYIAFSGHKLYAPFGAGALVGRSDWLDEAAPYLAGGGATAAVSTEGVTWATGPARHEGGTPHLLGAGALAAACDALREHADLIEEHEELILEAARQRLAAVPGLRLLHLFSADHARVPVLAFTVDGIASSEISRRLGEDFGIGVRDGRFCAHLLTDQLLERSGSDSSTAVRVSVGLCNTLEDVQRLAAAVSEIVSAG